MRQIKTTNAVGHILCHDITQIIRGVTKDAVFRKGHIVKEKDIPILLSLGKDNLYVWENQEDLLHENDAAQILCTICKNEYMTSSEVKEGKIDLYANIDGLFKINIERLNYINALGEIIIAARHSNSPVKKGEKLAGTRIIPLVIKREKMERAQTTAGEEPLFRLLPFIPKKAGVIVTGNEVYYGRIKDSFGPVIHEKLSEYGIPVISQAIQNDNPKNISQSILEQIENGADMIFCTGGMSVDPDDTTPTAVENTGAHIVAYGAPVLPGAMFLLAYYEKNGVNIPILGLPGCVMYSQRTVFDLILPRVLAGEALTARDITLLGHGGLCLNCQVCTFPNCSFGK